MINRLDIAEEIYRIWDKGTKSMKQHVQHQKGKWKRKARLQHPVNPGYHSDKTKKSLWNSRS